MAQPCGRLSYNAACVETGETRFPGIRLLRLFLGADFSGGFRHLGLGNFQKFLVGSRPDRFFEAIYAPPESFRQAVFLPRGVQPDMNFLMDLAD